MNSNKYSVRFLCLTAVMAALICVTTMVIQIPIPLGYANLGSAFLLLTVFFVGKRSGIWAGAIGAAMADILTGFAYWAVPSFIIKIGFAWIAGKIAYKNNECTLFSVRGIAGSFLGMVWNVAGYTVAGAVLYGGLAEGLASTPGLAMEGLVNLVVFYAVAVLFEKAKIRPLLTADKGIKA